MFFLCFSSAVRKSWSAIRYDNSVETPEGAHKKSWNDRFGYYLFLEVRQMKALKGFSIILISLMVGNLITALTKLPIPGSIFGMLILLILLQSKAVKLETVDSPASALLSVMVLLFIPGGVKLMNVYDKFDGVIIQVFAIIIVTTVAVMAVTGIVADQMIKARNKKGKE